MELTADSGIVQEAKKRFNRCERREAVARRRFVEDVKFANGDSRNNYQWDDKQRDARETDLKPCFTINKTRQHNLQIINDARQHKQAISIKATGDGATYKSAQILEGIVRSIEYQSEAQSIYQTAVRSQVQGGVGYWRVVTDYADEDSFDQEIFLKPVKDPLSVYLDPNAQRADRSDAKFGFVFDTLDRSEAEKTWPDLKDRFPKEALGAMEGWVDEDNVRVAEYFRVVEEKDELVALKDPQGNQSVKRMSDIAKDPEFADVKAKVLRKTLEGMGARFRPMIRKKVEWYKIAGDVIVDRRDWPGKYIPIVMLIGEETVINGELDRKGHTRSQIDPQRNYNYWTSEAAAQVALQTKSPYVADTRAIEGYETYWQTANRKNHPYLPYNGVDDDGHEIPRPQREQPPVMAQAYISGMNIAAEELRMASGQYQETMGANSNAQSGIAITQRQRQADNATYHYVDHLAMAIRYTGRIIIDLFPKVYDTARVRMILAEDGTKSSITIDPQAKQAYLEHEAEEDEAIKGVFNPNVGKYDVEADVGPAFATQRQEAYNALSQIIPQSPELMKIAGDLLMRAADFPLADEMAERMFRLVPPEALGKGPPPEVQQLQTQLQQMQQLMQGLTQKLDAAEQQLKSRADNLTVDAYDAETKRLAALRDVLPLDPQGLMALVRSAVADAIGAAAPGQAPQALQMGAAPAPSAPPAAQTPQMTGNPNEQQPDAPPPVQPASGP